MEFVGRVEDNVDEGPDDEEGPAQFYDQPSHFVRRSTRESPEYQSDLIHHQH